MSYRTRFVRLSLAYLRAQGRDPSALIEACALPADVETAESIEFALPKLVEYAERAAEFAGDPDLGIHLAGFSQRGDYGVAEYVALTSPTLGEAWNALTRFSRLLSTEGTRTLTLTDTELVLENRIPGHPLVFGRQINEFEFVRTLRLSRLATGAALVPRRVWFAHPQPASCDALVRALGRVPEFSRGSCGVALDRACADLRLLSADPNLTRMMAEHAKLLEQQLAAEHDVVAQVQETLKSLLQRGSATLEAVASALKMSGRTLQRKLAERSVSFASVLEELRKREAIRCLTRSGLTVTEIAFVLGYSDVSTFVRAFRGWTGQTPSEFREGHEGKSA